MGDYLHYCKEFIDNNWNQLHSLRVEARHRCMTHALPAEYNLYLARPEFKMIQNGANFPRFYKQLLKAEAVLRAKKNKMNNKRV